MTAKNIGLGKIDYEKSKEYILESDYEEVMHRGFPKIGDVLITTEAPMGHVAQIDDESVALAQRVIKYRSKDDTVLSNSYLKYYCLGTDFQMLLKKYANTGGTVEGIKGSILHSLPILIPNIEVQNSIAKKLDAFEKYMADQEDGLLKEIELRQKQYEYYRDTLLCFN